MRPARLVAAGAALLAAVGLAAVAVPAGPLAVDRSWAEAMRDLRTPFLTHVALVFDALGHGVWWLLPLLAVAAVLAAARRFLALAAFVAAETLSSLATGIVKAAVGRPRPPAALVHPVGSSFPSGHTAHAAVTCVALVLLVAPRRPAAWAAAALVVAGMAWSRTYLQAHWLSDVVAGAALGTGVALVVVGACGFWRASAKI